MKHWNMRDAPGQVILLADGAHLYGLLLISTGDSSLKTGIPVVERRSVLPLAGVAACSRWLSIRRGRLRVALNPFSCAG